MFTGIIEKVGTVTQMTRSGADAVLTAEVPGGFERLTPGESIAVNGACLTVVTAKGRAFTADVSAETLSKTTLGKLTPGMKVNLERALRMDALLGGHFVLGHVDCTGKIVERTTKSGSLIFGIELAGTQMKYVVEKGSIAVDGISLTVNRCEKKRLYVNIVPHTARETTLSSRHVGDEVNIETDILGKYVEKFINPGRTIDGQFLSEHGFTR